MELLLTIMARYRFNVLHWHLTDNTGWRMRAYPHLGNPALVNKAAHGSNQTLWPSAASLSFVEAAFHHACSIFPSPTIHIGGAATDWGQWESDSSLMRAGLTSDAVIERLFVDRRCTPSTFTAGVRPPGIPSRGPIRHLLREPFPRPPSRGRWTPGRRVFRSAVGPGGHRHPHPQPPGARQQHPRTGAHPV